MQTKEKLEIFVKVRDLLRKIRLLGDNSTKKELEKYLKKFFKKGKEMKRWTFTWNIDIEHTVIIQAEAPLEEIYWFYAPNVADFPKSKVIEMIEKNISHFKENEIFTYNGREFKGLQSLLNSFKGS